MEIKHCLRCDQDWCFRGTGRPVRCGQCKSPYWDRQRGDSSGVEQRPSSPPAGGSNPPPRSIALPPGVSRGFQPEPDAEDPTARFCTECDEPLREAKGKWACVDQGCALYGREQKSKEN